MSTGSEKPGRMSSTLKDSAIYSPEVPTTYLLGTNRTRR